LGSGAEAAGHLQLQIGAARERREQVVLARRAGAGAVEIDEMGVFGSALREVGERRRRGRPNKTSRA
jgi:hypothetical protein